jgi:hypothetical protein
VTVELGEPPHQAGILDLYAAVFAAVRSLITRQRLAIAIELGLVAAYVVIRSAGFDTRVIAGWLVVVGLLSIAAPVSGLTVLVAIAPFSEPLVVDSQLGAKPLLLLAVVVGAALRVRPADLRRTPRGVLVVVGLAVLLAIGTALGLGVALARFGGGRDGAELWLAGIGGAMLTLVAATAATGRSRRPLAMAVVVGIVAAVIALVDFRTDGAFRDGTAAWLFRGETFAGRLTGIIPSPNAVAALLIVPFGVLGVAVMLAPDRRLKLLAIVGLLPILAALYFTYSRAALIGIVVVVIVGVWRIRRVAGIALIALVLVGAVVAVPAYLQLRATSIGQDYAKPVEGQLFIPSDQIRLNTWASAARMWRDAPVIGQGFGTYRLLAPAYGDTVLRAPHNEWIRLFAEEGTLVGLIGLAFAATTFLVLMSDRRWLFAGIAAGFAGWCVAASFNNPVGFPQVNLVVFAVVGSGLAMLGRTEPGAAEPVPEAAEIGA